MSLQQQPVFFIDRSIGKHKVAEALRNAGELVEVHDDHFPNNTKDQNWLPVVAAKGWIILTADQKILTRKLELEAVKNSKAKLFVYASNQMSGEKWSAAFLAAATKIKRIAASSSGYLIAKVYIGGKVLKQGK
jgi:uncharacterized protein with PIN domain